jgi:hypothetical protein
MSVLGLLRPTIISEVPENYFLVVHPLDDAPEQTLDTSTLGPRTMTPAVKVSLMALPGYLALMMRLALYHVIDLAGAFRPHAH